MKIALVLSGGGARAAYQVGVLKYLAENFKEEFRPTILCGTSAGAINAAFLAQYMDDFENGVNELVRLWEGLSVTDIFTVQDVNLSKIGFKLAIDAVRGRLWKNISRFQSVFDTTPLANFLNQIINVDKIHANVENRYLDALTTTVTEYGTGKAIIFVESLSRDLAWSRVQRESRNVQITVQHVLASAAIPLVFPSIPIDGVYYGDGSMRDKSPFSPAAKLGADKIFAIGVRSLDMQASHPSKIYPSIASIGGTLADSIFVDALDADYENLSRINRILEMSQLPTYKAIDAFFLRPTHDLGRPANAHLRNLPPKYRNVFQGFGTSRDASSGFLSYLLFLSDYARELIQMGYEDGKKSHAEFAKFLCPKAKKVAA